MSIHDRANWPPIDDNPLIRLLRRDLAWVANAELAEALELVNTTRSKSVVGHYRAVLEELGATETSFQTGNGVASSRQRVRCFSKKALILIAMRSRTRNAAAFRDWLAERMAGEMSDA